MTNAAQYDTSGAAALDAPREWQAFSRRLPGEGNLWESFLAIGGMDCASCSLSVEDALMSAPGVTQAQVNGSAATARLVWSPDKGSPSTWVRALEKAGYSGVPAGDLLSAQPRQRAQRLLLWRWLVAGFCMMQVMMYAVPVYMADPSDMTPDIVRLLRWASWVLTLPVVLFSCVPFLRSAWRDLRALRLGMDVPVALGVVITFAASTAATFDPAGPFGQDVWFDSLTMFIFFLLSGRLLEQRLRDRTAGSLESLMRRMPRQVLRRDAAGAWAPVPASSLAGGDVIRVLPGELIPADGEVIEGHSRVDEALLTGESRPVTREATFPVIAGSHNLTGVLVVRVQRTGADTRYADIVALMERASVDKPRSAQLADRIASPFLAAVLVASAAAAAWWWPSGAAHAVGVAVAVLIVTCPCALSLATPSATLAAAGALARRGVLVRNVQALDACGRIDTVVFDKTGTLTQGALSATLMAAREGEDRDALPRMAAALASHSLHPVSVAVATQCASGAWAATGVSETAGQGVRGAVGTPGQPQRELRLGSAAFCGAPAMHHADVSCVHLADEHGWLASFELVESLRPDAVAVVRALQARGIAVQVLSGDLDRVVRRVAAALGIEDAWGERTPEDKLAHLAMLQQEGKRVMMIGDGMNDGPSLAKADVSVAFGPAVPIAKAHSDFVVQGERLAPVASLLGQARRTHRVVVQNLGWAALYNAACIPLALAGAMPPWLAGLGMAASSLLVMLNSARLSRMPAFLEH